MKRRSQSTTVSLVMASILLLVTHWLSILLAQTYEQGQNLFQIVAGIETSLNNPTHITWKSQTPRFLLGGTIVYGFAVLFYVSSRKNKRPGEEHGSAKWGNAEKLNRKYRGRKRRIRRLVLHLLTYMFGNRPWFYRVQAKMQREPDVLITQNIRMGMNIRRHRRNLNTLVVGGAGSGKSLFFARPNLMQANCSYIITDPKGELVRSTGGMLRALGYEVKVLDLINLKDSFGYNPLAYLRSDKDVLKLVMNLVRNTTPKGSTSNEPFWEKSEILLMEALMFYLYHEAPPYEQNWPMLIEMLDYAEVKEDDEDAECPLDVLFKQLERRERNHIAVRFYRRFKQAAGKTAKSILISVGVRLAGIMLPEIARVMLNDELDIGSLGEIKTAIFCLIPDNDSSMNFIIGMFYTQVFQELYHKADFQYKGRLPVHVRCIMDEFANVALPDEFGKILATCRSREISINIIIQAMAQLKALFKDDWESLVGNCDSLLYLGGNEPGTFEYISKLLDKETLDTNTYGRTRGKQGSSSTNDQQTGRELMTPGEVRLLDNNDALLFIRGERPIMDRKYNVWQHPRIKEIEEGGATPYDYAKDRGVITEHRFKTYKGLDAAQDFDFVSSEELDYEEAS